MMLTTGMLISGKMSVAMLRSTSGVASTISIAITMKVYGTQAGPWRGLSASDGKRFRIIRK
jgi:hypothetical protein